MTYSRQDLDRDFPTEQAARKWLFNHRYPQSPTCTHCKRSSKFYLLRSAPAFICGYCRHRTSLLKGTIFEASQTPLRLWYHALYLMATNKAGTSAKQIERELGVTYKTAWRMLNQIRTLMVSTTPLTGVVEVDETFMHPNPFKRSSARMKYGIDARRKGDVVLGIAERGGGVRVFSVPSTGARSLLPIITDTVEDGSTVHTDGYRGYATLKDKGYTHKTTDHGKYQFYTPDSSTQNIENFWSTWKPRMKGTYKHVSSKYLEAYASEYAFRYSYRNSPSIFWELMKRI